MSEQQSLHIRQYLPADLVPVQELFASGLIEFAGEAERGVRCYVKKSLKDDMADIPAHYLSQDRGNFWVAESVGNSIGTIDGQSEIVGIVGVQQMDAVDDAELRRMSVSSSARRQGIGRRLLETTEEFCREKGYHRICLSTVDLLVPALAMYRRYGYTTVKEEPYGEPHDNPIIVHYLIKELA
jgi:ribosomal protein S18 acetylase RimI-like enzyme